MPRSCDRSRSRGFTLIEVVLVMAIVGLLALTALPSISRLEATRGYGAALELERYLMLARASAMAKGVPVAVELDTANDTITMIEIATVGGAPTTVRDGSGQEMTPFVLDAAYRGVQFTAATAGWNDTGDAYFTDRKIYWFDYDGTPHGRSSNGVTAQVWTANAQITLTGGYIVTVYRNSGYVGVSP